MSGRAALAALVVLGLLPAVAGAEPRPPVLRNGSFDAGLEGWTVREAGGGVAPGQVTVADGQARLAEGDSLLVRLEQGFVMARGLLGLRFTVIREPGFDRRGEGIPDAFEVSLLDAARVPVVPGWQAGATAFYNLQQDEVVHLAAGVVAGAEGLVELDLRELDALAGQELTLVFALIGGDEDQGSALRVDEVQLQWANRPPVADAGPDQTVECAGPAGTAVLLDGAGSSDPDGEPLRFAWRDGEGVLLGEEETLVVELPPGEHPFVLTVTDSLGAEATADLLVTVQDTAGPGLDPLPGSLEVVVDAGCSRELPDLTGRIRAVDVCSSPAALQLQQVPGAGELSLELDVPVVIRFVVTDEAGNGRSFEVEVVLRDPQGLCGAPDPDAGELDAGRVDGGGRDGGSLPVDQGVVDRDEGIALPDQGVADRDEGMVLVDQGVADRDEGTISVDQGVADLDQGTPPVDQGTPERDQGIPPVDQGTPERDQGIPPVDQGTPERDQGTPLVDQGAPDRDQGRPVPDEGPGDPDGGGPRPDGGARPPDAGGGPDTGGRVPEDDEQARGGSDDDGCDCASLGARRAAWPELLLRGLLRGGLRRLASPAGRD